MLWHIFLPAAGIVLNVPFVQPQSNQERIRSMLPNTLAFRLLGLSEATLSGRTLPSTSASGTGSRIAPSAGQSGQSFNTTNAQPDLSSIGAAATQTLPGTNQPPENTGQQTTHLNFMDRLRTAMTSHIFSGRGPSQTNNFVQSNLSTGQSRDISNSVGRTIIDQPAGQGQETDPFQSGSTTGLSGPDGPDSPLVSDLQSVLDQDLRGSGPVQNLQFPSSRVLLLSPSRLRPRGGVFSQIDGLDVLSGSQVEVK